MFIETIYIYMYSYTMGILQFEHMLWIYVTRLQGFPQISGGWQLGIHLMQVPSYDKSNGKSQMQTRIVSKPPSLPPSHLTCLPASLPPSLPPSHLTCVPSSLPPSHLTCLPSLPSLSVEWYAIEKSIL